MHQSSVMPPVPHRIRKGRATQNKARWHRPTRRSRLTEIRAVATGFSGVAQPPRSNATHIVHGLHHAPAGPVCTGAQVVRSPGRMACAAGTYCPRHVLPWARQGATTTEVFTTHGAHHHTQQQNGGPKQPQIPSQATTSSFGAPRETLDDQGVPLLAGPRCIGTPWNSCRSFLMTH